MLLFFVTALVSYRLSSHVESFLSDNLQRSRAEQAELGPEPGYAVLAVAVSRYADAVISEVAISNGDETLEVDAGENLQQTWQRLSRKDSGVLPPDLSDLLAGFQRQGRELSSAARQADQDLRRAMALVGDLKKQIGEISEDESYSGGAVGGSGRRLLQQLALWQADAVLDTKSRWMDGTVSADEGELKLASGVFLRAMEQAGGEAGSDQAQMLEHNLLQLAETAGHLHRINETRKGKFTLFMSAGDGLRGRLQTLMEEASGRQPDIFQHLSEEGSFLSLARRPADYLMLMIGIGGLVGAIVGLVLLRGILFPVQALVQQTQAALSSDVHELVRVEGDDYLESLAHSFNTLIEQRQRTQQALRNHALYDPLTELPNREMFMRRLQEAMENGRRNERLVAVQILNLTSFKEINDDLGHHVGDQVLRVVAERLARCVRGTDLVARLGGDEFAVIQTNLDTPDGVHYLADRMILAVAEAIETEGEKVLCEACIGVSLYPNDREDAGDLLLSAELALKRAKQAGVSKYELYDPAMNEEVSSRRALEADIRTALAEGQFYLLYQPRVETQSGKVESAEALIRWNCPARGFVSPAEFIPVAETSGLIIEVTEFVIREVCRQTVAWKEAGLPPVAVSVNLSPLDFRRDDLLQFIQSVLDETGADPAELELEITEGMVMYGVEEVVRRLGELRELGTGLAIDDFGTGYSSMSYLRDFDVDTLKIDQSFIRGIPSQKEDIGITMAIIRMAHSLDLKVVAEGVETRQQMEFLKRRKCDQIQGYYFSRPLLPEDFSKFLLENAAATGKAAE